MKEGKIRFNSILGYFKPVFTQHPDQTIRAGYGTATVRPAKGRGGSDRRGPDRLPGRRTDVPGYRADAGLASGIGAAVFGYDIDQHGQQYRDLRVTAVPAGVQGRLSGRPVEDRVHAGQAGARSVEFGQGGFCHHSVQPEIRRADRRENHTEQDVPRCAARPPARDPGYGVAEGP